jgi:flagellar assembly factor FliW
MTIEKTVSSQPEIDSGKNITFPHGIPGFEKYTKFTIFHKEENGISVYWFESVEHPTVTFTLVDPTVYGLNYELRLTDEETKLLEAEDANSIAVLLILKKSEQQDNVSQIGLNANIAGPVIINMKNRIGLQKVITRPSVNVNIVEP